MSLPAFLVSLFEDGRVRVATPGEPSQQERADSLSLLVEMETQQRTDFPGEPPEFSPAIALWATTLLYRACQLAVYRDWGEESVQAAMSLPCPSDATPVAHYSIDLTWQFWPDLHRLTRQASPDDPLVREIVRLGAQWPLSSVGIIGVTPSSLTGIVDHPGLLQRYVDRVIARQDQARLTDPQVRAAVKTTLGIHKSLASEVFKIIHAPMDSSPTTGDSK